MRFSLMLLRGGRVERCIFLLSRHFVGGFLATSGTVAVQRSVIPVATYYAVYRRNEKVIQAFHSQSQMEV